MRALLPADWGEGYPNVTIACTAENQKRADERLPEYLDLPIKNKIIICEPLLGPINLKAYLSGGISGVIAGGESGEEARTSNYDWFLALRAQCVEAGVPFTFKQTGAHFIKAGKVEYRLDKNAIIHCAIGKKSFGKEKIKENYDALMEAIVKAKPAAAKGQYVKSVALASTMGPGVKVAVKNV